MARRGTCTITSGKKTPKVQEEVVGRFNIGHEVDREFKEKPISFSERTTSVRARIAKMAQSAAQGIAKVPERASKAATSVGDGIGKAARTTKDGVTRAARSVSQGINAKVVEPVSKVATSVGDGIGRAARATKDGVTKASRSAGKGIAKVPARASKAATSVGDGIGKAARATKDGVTKASRSAGRGIAKVPEHVTEAVQKTLFPSSAGTGVLHTTKELSATHLKYSPLHGLESNAVKLVSVTKKGAESLSNELSATGNTASRHTQRLSAQQESASKKVGRAK
ncbi:hypothetical protein [Anaplasma phagocytophilum]|uniref:Uncharacterized protein n=1 Tax=Anaplasma phagocytophilum str. CRT38 TaxID=1269275 RepID=S6G8Z3_ANAPH|nr:hypothetical protein [Anaplasma phagocytophilum]EOA62988.1 hypothetical protein CRT38_00775 [Anaplasma phagocytophilum str. CRT38]KDB57495.1 hypothetical protein P030_02075 [Anaplasma phagocytophilum str. CRT35]